MRQKKRSPKEGAGRWVPVCYGRLRMGKTDQTELALIERIRRQAADAPPARGGGVRLGIGDDCAVLRTTPGRDVVVTTDFSLEGRHFRRDWHSAASAGHRCLARGLSDLAAMGARPEAVFLSLALPAGFRARWVDGFMRGLLTLARAHSVTLAGGDTAQAPGEQILADIVCVGSVPHGRALLRSGARVGDAIYVSGALGGAAAELAGLAAGKRCASSAAAAGLAPQSFPQPRLKLGQALSRRRLATSCMDLSDGLSSDLAHLCRASGVDAELDLAAVPVAAGATLEQALNGGEDYELLFTAPALVKMPRALGGVRLHAIGRMAEAQATQPQIRADGQPLRARGWEHFVPQR